MYRSFAAIFILFSLFFISKNTESAEPDPTGGPVSETSEVPEGLPSTVDRGAIIFFPERTERPSEERHKVKAGEEITLCLNFNPGDSRFLQDLLKEATGYRLILEDSKVPPDAIMVTVDTKGRRSKEDTGDCVSGKFRVPKQAAPGVYQAADLLFRLNVNDFVSVREYLYGFSRADELEVENPNEDAQAPELVAISTFDPALKKKIKSGKLLKIAVKQSFLFQEQGEGIDEASLKVFYRLIEDGHTTGAYEARCHRAMGKREKFFCELKLRRPRHQWAFLELAMELDSVYIQDKANNRLEISDPKKLKEKASEFPIRFVFTNTGKGSLNTKSKYKNQLKTPEVEPVKPVESDLVD
jgi:hypothetical protein